MRIAINRKQGLYLNTGPTTKEKVPYGTILQKVENNAKYHSKFVSVGIGTEYIIGNTYLSKKIELQQINILT